MYYIFTLYKNLLGCESFLFVYTIIVCWLYNLISSSLDSKNFLSSHTLLSLKVYEINISTINFKLPSSKISRISALELLKMMKPSSLDSIMKQDFISLLKLSHDWLGYLKHFNIRYFRENCWTHCIPHDLFVIFPK